MTIDKHLGRSATGQKNIAYQTPDKVDPSLLVAVPRSENRIQYGLKGKLPFVGYDVWHAYEFSVLRDFGAPKNYILKIVYPSNSRCIVESKSLKLYLNSYNMDTITRGSSFRIKEELSKLLGVDVLVGVFDSDDIGNLKDPFRGFPSLDPWLGSFKEPLTNYTENPNLLLPTVRTGCNSINYISVDRVFRGRTSVLRSNCKVTHQPDWADVFVYWSGDKTIEAIQLLEYLISFRNENHFHEEICEAIYKRLWDTLNPEELFVACLYTRRGGIDINPVRASNYTLLRQLAPHIINSNTLTEKTGRQ